MEDIFLSDPEFDSRTSEELVGIIERTEKGNIARAIGALARRSSFDSLLEERVITLLQHPNVRGDRFMGTISMAHIGVLAMIAGKGGVIPRSVFALYTVWPEPDRSDLLWFLRSQGVDVALFHSCVFHPS
jgi:hypothetical protein